MTTTNLVAITGNTYPVKESLKAIGARWNADSKAWMITSENAAKAQAIVSGAPKQSVGVYHNSGGYRPYKCRTCGCAASRWNPIYRSGDCKDCWLSEKEEREMGY